MWFEERLFFIGVYTMVLVSQILSAVCVCLISWCWLCVKQLIRLELSIIEYYYTSYRHLLYIIHHIYNIMCYIMYYILYIIYCYTPCYTYLVMLHIVIYIVILYYVVLLSCHTRRIRSSWKTNLAVLSWLAVTAGCLIWWREWPSRCWGCRMNTGSFRSEERGGEALRSSFDDHEDEDIFCII